MLPNYLDEDLEGNQDGPGEKPALENKLRTPVATQQEERSGSGSANAKRGIYIEEKYDRRGQEEQERPQKRRNTSMRTS